MIPFIPMSDKTLLAVGGILLAAAAFGAGALVNGWRLESSFSAERAELKASISDLKEKIVVQNAAVDTMYLRSKEADLRRKQAAEIHKKTLQGIDKRIETIQKSQATECDVVLKEAHEDAAR